MPTNNPKRVLLVAGGALMRTITSNAERLYTSPLFNLRRAFAVQTCALNADCEWFVVSISIRHSLLKPNTVIQPYQNTNLAAIAEIDRYGWALTLVSDLLSELPDGTELHKTIVELHVGDDVGVYLQNILRAVGVQLSWPTAGMSPTSQFRWYYERVKRQPAEA